MWNIGDKIKVPNWSDNMPHLDKIQNDVGCLIITDIVDCNLSGTRCPTCDLRQGYRVSGDTRYLVNKRNNCWCGLALNDCILEKPAHGIQRPKPFKLKH